MGPSGSTHGSRHDEVHVFEARPNRFRAQDRGDRGQMVHSNPDRACWATRGRYQATFRLVTPHRHFRSSVHVRCPNEHQFG
jgi:hypothetical protein